jgi:hypothetical protein
MITEKLVEVYRAKDSAQAHVLKFALEDAGITSIVDGDPLQGSEYVGWATAPRLMVWESESAKAREILTQWEDRNLDHRDAN